jgi:hypothetical protein
MAAAGVEEVAVELAPAERYKKGVEVGVDSTAVARSSPATAMSFRP